MEHVYEMAEWHSLSSMHPGGICLTEKLLDLGEKFGINGRRGLDFGCGMGNSVNYLSKRNYQVTGVDSSWSLLAKAKERHPDFDFQHYNGMALSMKDNSFDFILCECTLSILLEENEMDTVMCEWRRVLEKEGVLLVSDLYDERIQANVPSETQWKNLFEHQNFEVLKWKDVTPCLKTFVTEWIWKNEKPFPWNGQAYHSMKSLHYYIAVLKNRGD